MVKALVSDYLGREGRKKLSIKAGVCHNVRLRIVVILG